MAAGQPGTTIASCPPELLWIHTHSDPLGQLWKPALRRPVASRLYPQPWGCVWLHRPKARGDALMHAQAGPTAPMGDQPTTSPGISEDSQQLAGLDILSFPDSRVLQSHQGKPVLRAVPALCRAAAPPAAHHSQGFGAGGAAWPTSSSDPPAQCCPSKPPAEPCPRSLQVLAEVAVPPAATSDHQSPRGSGFCHPMTLLIPPPAGVSLSEQC